MAMSAAPAVSPTSEPETGDGDVEKPRHGAEIDLGVAGDRDRSGLRRTDGAAAAVGTERQMPGAVVDGPEADHILDFDLEVGRNGHGKRRVVVDIVEVDHPAAAPEFPPAAGPIRLALPFDDELVTDDIDGQEIELRLPRFDHDADVVAGLGGDDGERADEVADDEAVGVVALLAVDDLATAGAGRQRRQQERGDKETGGTKDATHCTPHFAAVSVSGFVPRRRRSRPHRPATPHR